MTGVILLRQLFLLNKIFQHFFSLSFIKKKKFCLYDLREVYYFLIKILLHDSRVNQNFLILSKTLSVIFSDIFRNFYLEWNTRFFKEKKATVKIKNYFRLHLNYLEKFYFFKWREIFFKNFILLMRKLFFTLSSSLPFQLSCLISYFVSINGARCFSFKTSNLFFFLRKTIKAFSWNKFSKSIVLLKNIQTGFDYKNKGIFYFEELLLFLTICSLKQRTCLLNNIHLNYFFCHKKRKTTKAQKFLKNINNHLIFKECLFQGKPTYFQEICKTTLLTFNSSTNSILFFPKFKGHILTLKSLQKNFDLFFDFEEWKTILSRYLWSKVNLINNVLSKNFDRCRLFFFRIINFINTIQTKLLYKLSSLELYCEQMNYKRNFSYKIAKKGVSKIATILKIDKEMELENENANFFFLKLVIFIKKMILDLQAIDNNYFLKWNSSLLKKNKIFARKELFLRNLNRWELIFDHRVTCFLFSSLDLTTLQLKDYFELNWFSFRRSGL